MRVLVCGGRDFNDYNRLKGFLSFHDNNVECIMVIIHGGAKGADTLAGRWAVENNVKVECYPADWEKHGKAAGPIRNQQMIDSGKPDLGIAFPGGVGTHDMVQRLYKAGIDVIDLRY